MSFRITSITAFTAIDDDDEEGVMAFRDPQQGVWIPMVAADPRRLEELRVIANTLFADVDWRERRFVPEDPGVLFVPDTP